MRKQSEGGMSLITIILISVIGGLTILMVVIYGVMWFMAKRHQKKSQIAEIKKEDTNG